MVNPNQLVSHQLSSPSAGGWNFASCGRTTLPIVATGGSPFAYSGFGVGANIIFGTVIDRSLQGSVKVTVIATGFSPDGARQAVHEFAPAGAERLGAPEEPEQDRFMRPTLTNSLDFDATDDGLTPNFGKMKDDLDVPAFLRKQMD